MLSFGGGDRCGASDCASPGLDSVPVRIFAPKGLVPGSSPGRRTIFGGAENGK